MHVSAPLAILIHGLYSHRQSHCFGPGTLCLTEEDETHYILLHLPTLVLAPSDSQSWLPPRHDTGNAAVCPVLWPDVFMLALKEKLSFSSAPLERISPENCGDGQPLGPACKVCWLPVQDVAGSAEMLPCSAGSASAKGISLPSSLGRTSTPAVPAGTRQACPFPWPWDTVTVPGQDHLAV